MTQSWPLAGTNRQTMVRAALLGPLALALRSRLSDWVTEMICVTIHGVNRIFSKNCFPWLSKESGRI